MKRTLFVYKEYPEFPEATSFSKFFNAAKYVIGSIGGFSAIFALGSGRFLIGFLIIAGVIVFEIFLERIEKATISSIIKHSPPLSSQFVSDQELMVAKAKQRKAKYFLEVGTFRKEFKDEAQKYNMSVQEYKQYCKKCIEEYDEIYRHYNMTHSEKATY